MKLSILIPCYNEEENLPVLIQRICETFGEDFECVFVNDGSGDNTQNILKELAVSQDFNCKVISFTRNFGKDAAMYAGLGECEGEYISLLDADLQQNPKIIVQMIALLEENPGLDMVAAVQTVRQESFLMCQCKNIFYGMMNALSDLEFRRGAGDFRTFRSSVKDAVLSMKECQRFSKGLFCWGGFRVCYLPYEAEKRKKGKSKWSFFRLLDYGVEGITSFSTRPLRIAALFGLLFLLAATVSLTVSPLVFLILMSGGIQLLCMGILGEYIAGIFTQTKNRPAFLIREVYRHQPKNEKIL
ncbi:MAG: glycosyltransferase family 2 protein [Ruminococcaceae bacterium]|nr:glycosyltransferase family 2 protein [Oscillospiraceae bacterium]